MKSRLYNLSNAHSDSICGVLARCDVASFNPHGNFVIAFTLLIDEETNMLIVSSMGLEA